MLTPSTFHELYRVYVQFRRYSLPSTLYDNKCNNFVDSRAVFRLVQLQINRKYHKLLFQMSSTTLHRLGVFKHPMEVGFRFQCEKDCVYKFIARHHLNVDRPIKSFST